MADLRSIDSLDVPGGLVPELRIGTASGRVSIVAGERDGIEVLASRPARTAFRLDEHGVLDLTRAFGANAMVEVRCPPGTNAVVGTASGRVSVTGQAGRVRISSVSGAVSIEKARVAEVRTVSGRVDAREIADLARVATRSGRVTIERTAVAEVATASGRITLGYVSGDLRAQTISGRIELRTDGRTNVSARSVSGNIRVSLPRDTRPAVQVKSRSQASLPEARGEDCLIRLQSVSGKLEVVLE